MQRSQEWSNGVTNNEEVALVRSLNNPHEFWNVFDKKCLSYPPFRDKIQYLVAYMEHNEWRLAQDLWNIMLRSKTNGEMKYWYDYWDKKPLIDKFNNLLRQGIESVKTDYPDYYAHYIYLYGIWFCSPEERISYIEQAANLWSPRAQFDLIVRNLRWYIGIDDFNSHTINRISSCLDSSHDSWGKVEDNQEKLSIELVTPFLNHVRKNPWLLEIPDHTEQIIEVCDEIYSKWNDSVKNLTRDTLREALEDWYKSTETYSDPDQFYRKRYFKLQEFLIK